MKTCTKCKVTKGESQFNGHPHTNDGLQSWCKECNHKFCKQYNKEHMKEYYKSGTKGNASQRASNRKHHTGWSKEEYNQALTTQNSVCAICGGVNKNGRTLSADHCHTTGKKRALLCQKCNSILGYVNDDPKLLQQAIEYLKKHSEYFKKSCTR